MEWKYDMMHNLNQGICYLGQEFYLSFNCDFRYDRQPPSPIDTHDSRSDVFVVVW